MIKLPVIASMLVLFCACNSNRYFHSLASSSPRLKKLDSIVLDGSYTLYTRAVCQPAGNQNALRQDCASLPPGSGERVEIEYLLLSRQKGNMIYFSTAPHLLPGRYRQSFYNNYSLLNFDDFNRFHFGKIEEAQRRIYLQETNKPWQDIWEFRLNEAGDFLITAYTDSLTRKKAKLMVTENTLSFPIRFLRQDSISIGYQRYVEDGKAESFIPLEKNIIYFRKKNRKTFFIVFKTVGAYYGNVRYAEFPAFRTRYSPERLKE